MYIIDDYNYINGESKDYDPAFPHIIVVGCLGVGKSSYCKIMSGYDRDVNYISVQSLTHLGSYPIGCRSVVFIPKAKKIIHIKDVTDDVIDRS